MKASSQERTSAKPAKGGAEAASSELIDNYLAALPRLSADELIPEVNGLMIDEQGRLVPRARKQQYIVTFDLMRRRLTARFAGGRNEPVTMELGCRLMRLPYSIEDTGRRRELLTRISTLRKTSSGTLSVTHHQWLYLHDRLLLQPSKLTASWIVTQLTLASFIVRPAVKLFAELDDAA